MFDFSFIKEKEELEITIITEPLNNETFKIHFFLFGLKIFLHSSIFHVEKQNQEVY